MKPPASFPPFVTEQFFTQPKPSEGIGLASPLDAKSASPLGWLLDPDKSKAKVDRSLELQLDTSANILTRVLSRMAWQEATEERNPHLCADRRIAWITFKWSMEGVSPHSNYAAMPPHVAATFTVLNWHPDEVWPRIVANRREKLGDEYSAWYDAAGNLRPDALKKDSASAGQRKMEVA